MTALPPPIQRSRFGLVMVVATLCAVGASVLLAGRAEGADSASLLAVGGTVLAGAALAVFAVLGPAFIKDEHWGLAVLGVSAARTMLAMFAMLILIEVAGLPRQPVVHGLLAGTIILTTAEAAGAVWQLQRREAARVAMKTDQPMPSGVNATARRST